VIYMFFADLLLKNMGIYKDRRILNL